LKSSIDDNLASVLDKMIETIPARRYQTVDEILQDLHKFFPDSNYQPITKPVINTNSQPVANNTSQTSNHLIPTVASTSQIDSELEEIKTMFLGASKPKSNDNSQPQPEKAPQTKSKIDEELEEIRSRFLGNNP
jgi:serine/threonine protein kinase